LNRLEASTKVPRSRADRFLAAFNQVEQLLRDRISADRHLRFYELVDRAARSDATVAAFAIDLKEFADLRNAIVHERGSGKPIANPYPETVAAIEATCELIRTPPRVSDVIRVDRVETCEPRTLVLDAASVMRTGDFSQLPVIIDGKVAALLTAETVMRFIASHRFAVRICRMWRHPASRMPWTTLSRQTTLNW
jgi:hypothetical protein